MCRSVRAAALHPRHQPQRSGIPAAIRCAIPRTHRWAGAATPTQRNTIQAQERARRASDAINVSNFTSKNNPRWRPAEPVGAAQPSRPRTPDRAAGAAAQASPARLGRILASVGRILASVGRILASVGRILASVGRILASVGQVLLNWLAAIPRRLGDRLFVTNDTEAYWRDWQITKTRGGLARRYRDPWFDMLAECPKCHGAGVTADLPCAPCLGTGRITLEEVS